IYDRARILQVTRVVRFQIQVERRQRFGRPEPEPSLGARSARELRREPSLGRLDRRVRFQRMRGVEQAVAQDRIAPMRLLDEQLAAGVRRQPLERPPRLSIFYPP